MFCNHTRHLLQILLQTGIRVFRSCTVREYSYCTVMYCTEPTLFCESEVLKCRIIITANAKKHNNLMESTIR